MNGNRLSQLRFVARALALALALCVSMTPAIRAEEGAITHESLKSLLEGLGYEPEERHFSDTGAAFYKISTASGGLTVYVDFNVSDPAFLWLSVDYWALADDQQFPPQVPLDLLAENEGLKYTHFLYLADERRIRLAGKLLNRGIKPADVRRMLDEAVAVSARTQHLWNPNNWETVR
jgi:hypothetical protein